MAKQYCKRCSILIKQGLFGGGIELADGLFCNRCGNDIRQERIGKTEQPMGWKF